MSALPNNQFFQSLQGLFLQSPVLLVSLIGLFVAIAHWERAPGAALWAALGFGLALLVSIAGPLSQQFLVQQMREQGVAQMAQTQMVVGAVWSILRAVSYVFLLVAAFTQRENNGPGFPVQPPFPPR